MSEYALRDRVETEWIDVMREGHGMIGHIRDLTCEGLPGKWEATIPSRMGGDEELGIYRSIENAKQRVIDRFEEAAGEPTERVDGMVPHMTADRLDPDPFMAVPIDVQDDGKVNLFEGGPAPDMMTARARLAGSAHGVVYSRETRRYRLHVHGVPAGPWADSARGAWLSACWLGA